MELVTYSLLVMSAIAITLGVLCLRLWITETNRRDFLFFALACFSAAIYSWFEIAIMKADSVESIGRFLWWSQYPAGLTVISVALFIHLYLNPHRYWLFWSIIGLRSFGLLINLFIAPTIQFSEITSVGHSTLLGESLSIPVGVGRPLSLINLAVLVLFFSYCIDTAILVWNRGERRKAIIFGGGVAAFILFIGFITVCVIWIPIGIPVLASPALMFLIMAIGFELNYDLHRSARLAKSLKNKESELHETIEQLQLSANMAEIAVWIRSAAGELIWASEKWYEFFELNRSETITFNHFLDKIHPRDRDLVREALASQRKVGDEYEIDYRVLLNSGNVRWIHGRGKVDLTAGGKMILRGASMDVTKLKLAQEAAHDLSHRLMDAQEKERARLARELHDGLGQSLALLSIQLESLGDPSAAANGNWKQKIRDLSLQIERLSSDVHRISHELHPSKLEQLGLVAALRGFCREMASIHRLNIDFEASLVPRNLYREVSLCMYRVAQEALQNITEHSGASNVNVRLQYLDDELTLIISDNGSGFAIDSVREGESLGLISMYERLKVLQGRVEIESELGAGTKIVAIIPYSEKLPASYAA